MSDAPSNKQRWIRLAIILAPIVIALAPFVYLKALPDGYEFHAEYIRDEQYPVELLTAAFLLAAAGVAVAAARREKRRRSPTLLIVFWWVFAIGAFLTGMEEIAWGQHIFRFEPPALFEEYNQQNEVTIHNLPWFHRKTELLRLAFALGGLLGYFAIGRLKVFKSVRPPGILVHWFLILLLFGIVDTADDFVRLKSFIHEAYDKKIFSRIHELDEMSIGLCALIYAVLCYRRPPES